MPDDQKRKTLEGKGGMLQGNREKLHKVKVTWGRGGSGKFLMEKNNNHVSTEKSFIFTKYRIF